MGWYGIIGQNFSWIFAVFVIHKLAPSLQRDMRDRDLYAITDWIKVRYSRSFHIYASVVSTFCLLLFGCVGLASIADLFALHVPGSHASLKPIIVFGILFAVYLYCAISGFASSVHTDVIQGILIVVLAIVVISTILITESLNGTITTENIRKQSAELSGGDIFVAALAMNLSLFWVVVLDFTFWQRMFCVTEEDRAVTSKACVLGLVLICPLLTVLGCMGLFLRGTCTDPGDRKYEYNALFFTVGEYGQAWVVICLVLVISLKTSSLDSYLYACLSIISSKIAGSEKNEADKLEDASKSSLEITEEDDTSEKTSETDLAKSESCFSTLKQRWFRLRRSTRVIIQTNAVLLMSVVFIGVMASLISCLDLPLGNTYYITNMMMSTLVFPIFGGIFLPLTSLGSMCGAISGLLTCFLYGFIEFEGSFLAGLEMFIFMLYTSDPARKAHERQFGVVPGQRPLLNEQLFRTVSKESIPDAELPRKYGDHNYKAFLQKYSTEIQSYLQPGEPYGQSIDLPMRPRFIILTCLIPLVTLIVSVAVSFIEKKIRLRRKT